MTALSCYAYRTVRLTKSADIERSFTALYPSEQKNQSENSARSDRWTRPRHIHVKKFFIELRFPSPVEKINNMGVEAAVAGLFPEARNLFLEAITEMPESAAPRNNLGVIYELFGDREKAFAMYSEAYMLDPGNSIVRGNYLSFEETSSR